MTATVRARAELPPTSEDWERLIGRIRTWVGSTESVRAAAAVGSRARSDRPADRWSDLDLVLLVDDPSHYSETGAWASEIAPCWLSLGHDAPIPGIRVRQILFEGGLDVDVVPLRAGTLSALVAGPEVADLFGRGFRVIADKDGELSRIDVPAIPAAQPEGPTEGQWLWVIEDFLFQAVWTTKHLRRGELWLAKDDVDSYMKALLLEMIEWQAVVSGREPETWSGARSGGRMLERWADPRILHALPPTFASYDPPDVGRALLALMELFRSVGREVGERAGVEYPERRHDVVERWVRSHLEEMVAG